MSLMVKGGKNGVSCDHNIMHINGNCMQAANYPNWTDNVLQNPQAFKVVVTPHVVQKTPTKPSAKIVVLGNSAVGKSALVVRFLTGRFIWEYDPTLERIYRYHGTMDDENVCLDILDTAGQGDANYQVGNLCWGEGFLIVYSITDRSSFNQVTKLHQKIVAAKKSNHFMCIMAGNKCDLNHERQVCFSEGEALASKLGCGFLECSASDGDHQVYEAFWTLHRDLARIKSSTAQRRRRSSAQHVMQQVLGKMFTKIHSEH